MSEFKEYGPIEDEVEEAIEDNPAEEVVETLREDLNFIYNNPENGQLFEQILQSVEANYE